MNRVTRCICSPTPHVWRPVYVCAVYLSVLESVPFTEKIKFSSTNMWWIYTGVEFERSQRFLFFFGISIWTMHHQLAKRAVIVVIICLSEECFQHNQCFNQWSPLAPAKYIFYRATKRRLYLIRKSGGKNQDCDIFWEAIYCIINRLPLDETGKHEPFPVLIWRRTCLECAKIIYPLVYVTTFNHWINVIFITAAKVFLFRFYTQFASSSAWGCTNLKKAVWHTFVDNRCRPLSVAQSNEMIHKL